MESVVLVTRTITHIGKFYPGLSFVFWIKVYCGADVESAIMRQGWV